MPLPRFALQDTPEHLPSDRAITIVTTPIPYGNHMARLELHNRYEGEDEAVFNARRQFRDAYANFVDEGTLTPSQESALRRAYLDAQLTVVAVQEMPVDLRDEMDREASSKALAATQERLFADVEGALHRILTKEQLRLAATKYPILGAPAALASMPFTIE
jgi:hypothetical protein